MHTSVDCLGRAVVHPANIAPGAVSTRWWAGNEEKMRAISGNLPLQRISTPEDVADVTMMLLEAASMTGQIVKCENGQTL